MEAKKIPGEVLTVVRAARGVVRARLELRVAVKDRASEDALRRKRAAFNTKLDALETATIALESRIEEASAQAARALKAAKRPPFDWGSVFSAAGKLAELVMQARTGVGGSAGTRPSGDVIDGEILD